VGKITAFLTVRTAYETDNSTGNRIAKDEAKGEMVDAMKEFANSSIRFNKKMHDEDKLVYGIHPVDTTPTYHGTPTSQPGTEVENIRPANFLLYNSMLFYCILLQHKELVNISQSLT
jgi:hypothetical protein